MRVKKIARNRLAIEMSITKANYLRNALWEFAEAFDEAVHYDREKKAGKEFRYKCADAIRGWRPKGKK